VQNEKYETFVLKLTISICVRSNRVLRDLFPPFCWPFQQEAGSEVLWLIATTSCVHSLTALLWSLKSIFCYIIECLSFTLLPYLESTKNSWYLLACNHITVSTSTVISLLFWTCHLLCVFISKLLIISYKNARDCILGPLR
jgi:hypothetical protein